MKKKLAEEQAENEKGMNPMTNDSGSSEHEDENNDKVILEFGSDRSKSPLLNIDD